MIEKSVGRGRELHPLMMFAKLCTDEEWEEWAHE